MNLGMYIMAHEPISTKIPPINLFLYMYLSIVARQRLGKNITDTRNNEQSLEASFSMRSVSFQRKVDD
jgi:hypothetical protein